MLFVAWCRLCFVYCSLRYVFCTLCVVCCFGVGCVRFVVCGLLSADMLWVLAVVNVLLVVVLMLSFVMCCVPLRVVCCSL